MSATVVPARRTPVTVRWLGLGAATALATLLAARVGLPSPSLFAALVVGVAYASSARLGIELPPVVMTAAQAITGVALGAYLQVSTLAAVAAHWLPVLGVTLATLGLTLLAGLLLARVAGLDRPTASLGMIAGGATGIVAMSRDLGADDRLVAVMQYLRVLVVVLLAPVLARLAFSAPAPGPAAAGAVHGAGPSLAAEALFTLTACALGLLAARAVRLPAGSLLGPLLVAGALSASGLAAGTGVPAALRDLAFALIGLQVGLRFTRETLRRAGRLLGPVMVAILAMILACAALAAALAPLAHVSLLDAYLATTPGGLYAVLATALGSGANTTFVLAVQALRLFVMVLAAPPLVRRLLHA